MRRTLHPSLSCEDALRWLATRRGRPLELLAHAIGDPTGDSSDALQLLVDPTASVPDPTPQNRSLAVWGLLIDEVNKIGAGPDSARRTALQAAFRMQRPAEITGTWKPALGARFEQLKAVHRVFGPRLKSRTPMQRAWDRGLERLVPSLEGRLEMLTVAGDEWAPYIEAALLAEREGVTKRTVAPQVANAVPGYRKLSPNAQPLFAELFVTTVFMKGRTAYRRITERLMTAQVDNVDGYVAMAMAKATGNRSDFSVKALWGCRAEEVEAAGGDPAYTKLKFPRPLRRGESHYFSSEAVDEHLTAPERIWVNITIDHYGIAAGKFWENGLPVSGLTIRIRFDDAQIPTACWWYAEELDRERQIAPPEGDRRRLRIVDGAVTHTFDQVCHPRESYGVSILWSNERA